MVKIKKTIPMEWQKKRGIHMGFRFRKSINLGPGMKINFNKRSVGVSFGKKGMRYSVNSNGRSTASVGIPGTGLYYTKTNNSHSNNYQSAAGNGNPTQHNQTCKRCGAVVYPTDKVCRNCGYNLQNKDIPTIVWLVLFFPVGLYFMWAKTNWSKVAKIIISAFFAVSIILFTGITLSTADDLPEIKVSQTGITELEFLRTDDVELDLTSNFKSSKNSYFYVKGNDSFKIDDIEFISSNPDVAEIKYSSTALTTHVYYDITAVSPGETTVYVQTTDGIIKSEEIKVIVTGETTTESTTENATKETSTKEENTTEKQTSSQKETTTKKETSTKKVTTTQKQTSTKKETNSPNSNGTAVYRTPSGKRYHYDPDCGGKNSYKISLDDAKSSGLTPCQKCVH